ncbi:LysR family transcriptional regulator [Reinekea forsetii]|nr:LysR family transcriptional regulator [Reinekea forsetii]
MELDNLNLFIETINQGSITKAAEKLGKPKSTVSRQLTALETSLGVKLMERTTRKLHLTEAGEALYARSAPFIEELNDIGQEINAFALEPKGQLSILWPQELFTQTMSELISEFLNEYPKVSFCGTQYNGVAPKLNPQIDLHFVLHQHPLPDSDWIAQSLMSIPQGLYIAAHCANKAPKHLTEVSDFPCILQGGEYQWLFRRERSLDAIEVSGRLTLNSPDMRLQAAIRGLGLVRLPVYLAEPYIRRGALAAVALEGKPVAEELSVIYKSRHLPLKTRLFLEHFQGHLGRLYSQI